MKRSSVMKNILNSKPIRNPGLKWREIKGRVVVSATFGLNITGAKIWKLCDGKNTIGDILERIHGEFPYSDWIFIVGKTLSFLLELEKNWLIFFKRG